VWLQLYTLFIFQIRVLQILLKVDVKVTTDGGSTFYHVGKSLEIDVNNTLVLDKPINLETNDIIRIVAELNIDSSSPDVEAYASILEIS
jgi:hypothetical protein